MKEEKEEEEEEEEEEMPAPRDCMPENFVNTRLCRIMRTSPRAD